jgi:hypothetical protein
MFCTDNLSLILLFRTLLSSGANPAGLVPEEEDSMEFTPGEHILDGNKLSFPRILGLLNFNCLLYCYFSKDFLLRLHDLSFAFISTDNKILNKANLFV